MANKKTPYRIYLPDEVIKALDDAAEKTGEQTGNQVAAEVVTHCLPIWLAAREASAGVFDDFLSQTIEEVRKNKSLGQKK